MASVNLVILVGHIGKTPETRYMTNGDAVTNATLATSETWQKDGEKQERTTWHNLVFYRKLADIVGEHVTKGMQIYVEGKLNVRKWQDKEGNDRYTTEVICNTMKMLGSKPAQQRSESHEQESSSSGFSPDDDIPY